MPEPTLDDLRDVITGFYGLASEDDTAEKRLARVAHLLGVPESEWDWAGATATWYVDLPCPECGLYNLFGVSLVLEGFGHNHTKYFCRSWIKPEQGPGQGVPCGWWGWSVPGWDAEVDPS